MDQMNLKDNSRGEEVYKRKASVVEVLHQAEQPRTLILCGIFEGLPHGFVLMSVNQPVPFHAQSDQFVFFLGEPPRAMLSIRDEEVGNNGRNTGCCAFQEEQPISHIIVRM